LFAYSRTPWGPWSEPQIIFNAARDGALGKFIHDPQSHPDDGLAGPVIGKGQANPQAVHGGAYAPYVVERWTKVQGSELSVYYVLSTWNPYVVVLMKSRMQLEARWPTSAITPFVTGEGALLMASATPEGKRSLTPLNPVTGIEFPSKRPP
jgi:hypothetical protein